MLAVRDAISKIQDLAKAAFTTLRLRLLKIAARIIETKSRIRVAFATACPDAELFVVSRSHCNLAALTQQAACLSNPKSANLQPAIPNHHHARETTPQTRSM